MAYAEPSAKVPLVISHDTLNHAPPSAGGATDAPPLPVTHIVAGALMTGGAMTRIPTVVVACERQYWPS
jgi:hypothetical protein